MKIGIYQPRISYYIGGGEIVPLEHAKYLSNRGHDVTLYTTKAEYILETSIFKQFIKNNKKIKIVYVYLPNGLKWIYDKPPGADWRRWDLESIHVARHAIFEISKNKHDLVVTHNIIDLLGIPPQTPTVIHLHGYPEKADYIHELVLQSETNIIAVSKHVRHKWEQLITFRKPIDVSVNGIDSIKFRPKLNKSKTYDLIYIGRLLEIKGVQYLIKAIAKLKKEYGINIKCGIGGIGPYEKEIKNLVHKLNIQKSVIFLGYIDDKDLVNVYNNSKIAVFPSTGREGVLTTMLEAASCGLPIITTSSSSMIEFIINGKNGFLVEPKNPEDLAFAIKKLLNNEELRQYMGSNNVEIIKKNWDWQTRIIEIEKLYKSYI